MIWEILVASVGEVGIVGRRDSAASRCWTREKRNDRVKVICLGGQSLSVCCDGGGVTVAHSLLRRNASSRKRTSELFYFFWFFVVWICIGRREEGRLNVVECTVGTSVWLWKWKLWCPVWRLLWASFHLFKVGNSVGLVVVASAGVWGNYSSERGRSWDALIFHIVAIVVVVKFIHRITTWINLDGYSADSLNKNLSVVGFDTFLMENNRWMTGNSSFFFFETRI